jgi:hypothetical protein
LTASSFPTPELTLELDFGYPALEPFAPSLFDCFPAPLPVSSAPTSLTTTPSVSLHQSPSPAPPSPDGPGLFPGLKLPPQHNKQHKPSKPGRRPGGASLSHTADGRITKCSAAAIPATTTEPVAGPYPCSPDDDPEVISRRFRNNLAAKRYRQKKIDRIQELEDEVKEVKQERDDLRIRLARQEAEIAALREMLTMIRGGGSERPKD